MDQTAKRDSGKPMGEYSTEFDRLRQATDSAGSVGTVGTPINMERGDY